MSDEELLTTEEMEESTSAGETEETENEETLSAEDTEESTSAGETEESEGEEVTEETLSAEESQEMQYIVLQDTDVYNAPLENLSGETMLLLFIAVLLVLYYTLGGKRE